MVYELCRYVAEVQLGLQNIDEFFHMLASSVRR